ncbi:hypothetical protein ACIGW8_06170 [Streptomyces sioyaensis]
MSTHPLTCIRRRVERIHRAPLPARLVALHLWLAVTFDVPGPFASLL